MENAQIAGIFEEIADLLELQEANEFRVRSYRSAARTVRDLSERLEDLVRRGDDLSELPDIGESTAEKIREIVDRGTCARLEELRNELPTGLTEVMRIQGVGPKKAIALHRNLQIDSLDDLRHAAQAGKVRQVEGFGETTERKILDGLDTLSKTSGRILYHEAVDHVETLTHHLETCDSLMQWQVAGSFRRARETVGDLDILLESGDRERSTEEILDYEQIRDVEARGEEKITVRLHGGLQVDFRFFESESFGAAEMYFTGSKAHNIGLRRIARQRGWKLNEYGIFKGAHRLAGREEEGVYRRLNLAPVPPELREDRGEIAAAAEGRLPALLESRHVRGDLQSHTTASDGAESIERMARAAAERGREYLAITDHSQRVTMAGGLDDDACREHADRIREVDRDLKNFRLLAGIEVDILKDGSLDLAGKTLEGLDWVVGSIHYDRNLPEDKMTDRLLAAIRSGRIHALGHPLGRVIGRREPMAFDTERVFAACAENEVYLEINAQPDRLDLPDTYCRQAAEAGVKFCLGTDAHKIGDLDFMPYAVNVARRGWLGRKQVLNTLSAEELLRRTKRS
jgi:DNA polymerase (family 10)